MDTISLMTIVLLVLCLKHFIADGPLQTNWMAFNKGTFGHPGGLVHAGIHAALTFLMLFLVPGIATLPLLLIAVGEFVVHYMTDFTKMSTTKSMGWSDFGPDDKGTNCLRIRSPWYFYGLMADQCIHFATYILMAWLLVT